MTNDVEHFYMYLFFIFSSFMKYLFRIFAHFKTGLFAFYYWVVVLYIFWTQVLCQAYNLWIFSPNLRPAFSFSFEVYLFWERERESERENPKQASHCQHQAWCGAPTQKLQYHHLSWNQSMLNPLSHPGAPCLFVFLMVSFDKSSWFGWSLIHFFLCWLS